MGVLSGEKVHRSSRRQKRGREKPSEFTNNPSEEGRILRSLTEEAQNNRQKEQKHESYHFESGKGFLDMCELKVSQSIWRGKSQIQQG